MVVGKWERKKTTFMQMLTIQSGQSGLGKSTLVNTIFASHLIESKARLSADEPPRQTTEIQTVSHCKYIYI